MMFAVLLIFLAAAARAPQAAPPDPLAESLLTALAVHDARLRSLEWKQRVTVNVEWIAELVVIEEGAHGFDDDGNWYCHDRYGNFPEVGSRPIYFERFIDSNDFELRGFQSDAREGLIRLPEPSERGVYPTPATLSGRWADGSTDMGLSDFLRESRKLRAVEDGPRVVLTAWRDVAGQSSYVEVECDPQRDWLPVRIEKFDVCCCGTRLKP
jgi:hypothetical protein